VTLRDWYGPFFVLISLVVLVYFNSNKNFDTSSERALPSQSELFITSVRVYDGDTIYVDVMGVPDVFGKNLGVRIRGIDTPEIRDSDLCVRRMAKLVKERVERFIGPTELPSLRNVERGKYFRLVADVYIQDASLAETLLREKRAKPWNGEGTKPEWVCDQSWFS
jgi:micrococcal nuclease